MTLRWTPLRFRIDIRYISKIRGRFIVKIPLSSYPSAKLHKALLNSGSLIFLCTRAQSNHFSRILISVSVRIFQLKLNTVSEQKYLNNLPSLVTDTRFLKCNESFIFWIFSGTDNYSLSCVVNSISCEVRSQHLPLKPGH